jgi:pyruvate/2-oxoglutarate dehydrogenase complex dihydrolipoamide dehydrogenase (E3) component
VKLGVEVTPDVIENEKPDALVISAGSVPMTPEIPGINTQKVVNAVDVLSGQATVGGRVVVIGGELVGCETADFLSHQGKKVTVLRRGPEMATKINAPNRQALLSRLREKGVTMITGIAKYEAITQDGLVIVDGDGKRRTLEADTIVLAAGAAPDNHLAKVSEEKVAEIHLVGDCTRPGRILEAIHDGARIGREI